MIRIVAGEWGGRRIATPPGRATRPTAEKVRGAVFNVLQARTEIEDAEVWDLFAGSGAMGIEALSRGARRVHFVESDPRTAAMIRATLASLGADASRWSVTTARAEGWLERAPVPGGPLIVLIDPPYAADSTGRLLEQVATLGTIPDGAWIVLESASHAAPPVPGGLELVQVKRYGGTGVQFLRKGEPRQGAAPLEQDHPGNISDERTGDDGDA